MTCCSAESDYFGVFLSVKKTRLAESADFGILFSDVREGGLPEQQERD